jgi:uncharacterized membrane protein
VTDGSRAKERDRGAVLVVVALSMGFLLAATALTVDLGRLMMRRRDVQNVADVVALDLVRRLDGRTHDEILADPSPVGFAATIVSSRTQNDFAADGRRQLVVSLGTMTSTGFVADANGAAIPSAVKVIASDDVDYFFMPGTGTVSRTAVAQREPSACFALGSYALSMSSANSALLNGILGNALHTGALSYNGIANAQITLGALATQLGFGTPAQLLTSQVDYDTLVTAAANVLQANGDTASAAFLLTIPPQTPGPSPMVSMSNVITTQPGSESAALEQPFNVLDLNAGAAFVANGTNAIAVPQVTVNVPGVSNVTASLTVVEKAQRTCGKLQAFTQPNRQTTLHITASLPNATMNLNLALASGVATLNAMQCGSPTTLSSVTIGVRSDLISVSGSVGVTIPPVTLGLVAPAGQAENSSVTFTVPPPLPQMASTGTGSVGLAGTTLAGNAVVAASLQPVLDALTAQLDTALVAPLTDLLGINVAGADVFALDIHCKDPALVQ